MTLTRSGRSVNRPAKYVNAATTVLEPTQPSPLKRPREEAILKPAFDAPKTDRVVGLRLCGEKEPSFVGSRLETEADSNRALSERLRPSAECSRDESDCASKDIERTIVVLAENVADETDANVSRPHQFFFFAPENNARYCTGGHRTVSSHGSFLVTFLNFLLSYFFWTYFSFHRTVRNRFSGQVNARFINLALLVPVL
jgi:hypothetical protein